ncbi:MAG: hypothetical protein KY467_07820 [Gemmatimonadetes bacterium]|nr:hypothetical protein [Gemmatimonadota bacterium]
MSRREWKRQLTCHTPLQRLPWFTGELVGLLAPFDRALLIIDQIVFDVPAQLEALRRAAGETRTIHEAPGHLVERDQEGFRRLLEVVLSGWVDFRVVFSPARHALRADHDEFTTFFSMSPGQIARVREALAGEVQMYDRTVEPP